MDVACYGLWAAAAAVATPSLRAIYISPLSNPSFHPRFPEGLTEDVVKVALKSGRK